MCHALVITHITGLTIISRPLDIDSVCQDWGELAQWSDVDWPETVES